MEGATRAGQDASSLGSYFAFTFYTVRGLWAVQKVPPYSTTHVVSGADGLVVADGHQDAAS